MRLPGSIYYDKTTKVISLPNIYGYQCKKCDNSEYLCLLCNKCKLHDWCWEGRYKFMVDVNGQYCHSYDKYCAVCCKTNHFTNLFCSVCYVCDNCHADKCEYMRRFCKECNLTTIHCTGCNNCLLHSCHVCSAATGVKYGHFINIEPINMEDYSPAYYKDRCSTCIRFVAPANIIYNPEIPIIDYLKSTLWICRICVSVECGMCFNQRNEVCSLCAADTSRYFNTEDFSDCYFSTVSHGYKKGEVCAMCGTVEIGANRDELWYPYYCKICLGTAANSYEFDITRIPKLRSNIPHIAALLPLSRFPDIIKYCIFEYYYIPRHYYTGELEDSSYKN